MSTGLTPHTTHSHLSQTQIAISSAAGSASPRQPSALAPYNASTSNLARRSARGADNPTTIHAASATGGAEPRVHRQRSQLRAASVDGRSSRDDSPRACVGGHTFRGGHTVDATSDGEHSGSARAGRFRRTARHFMRSRSETGRQQAQGPAHASANASGSASSVATSGDAMPGVEAQPQHPVRPDSHGLYTWYMLVYLPCVRACSSML